MAGVNFLFTACAPESNILLFENVFEICTINSSNGVNLMQDVKVVTIKSG